MFNRNKLSAAIVTVVASLTAHNHATAQDSGIVEEVMVTGIRASLEAAMDIKRDSAGVVDAISAEDIGKFPDTNLAESLQRITGVSISRQNGEGSEVTVRGFGPGNNMITLNGRTMPTGTSYGGGSGADASTSAGGSRAFNFANLASESVSGVEVYKTSKASIATGGIGATINIKTTRPLENPGLNFSVGAKAVNDTTNRYNDDVTPELSGVISWTDDSETFGAALSLSYQERHSASSSVTGNYWHIGVWGEDDLYDQGPLPEADLAEIVNPPELGQLYARPNDFRYAFSDQTRERLNGQLTLQYRPTENITATLDYTRADNDIEEHRGEIGNWIQNGANIERVVFDNSAIKTPLTITEYYGGGTVDVGYEQQYRSQSNTLDSLGLNLEFVISDSFTVNFDVHNSTMESLPTGPGASGEVAFGMGAPIVGRKTLDFTNDIPVYSFETSNANNGVTEQDVGSSILRIRGSGSTNEITQVQLAGSFEFDDGRFDFGIEGRDMEMKAYQTAGNDQTLGDWGIANPGEFAGSGLLYEINIHDEFEDFAVGQSPAVGWRGDAVALTQYAIDSGRYPSAKLGVEETFSFQDILSEEVLGAYVQFSLSGELAGFPMNILAGLRYEHTDITSQNQADPLRYLEWRNNNDFSPGPTSARVLYAEDSSYDNMLPSLDFDLSFTDDIIGRASFSKSIARAGFGDLRAAPSNFGRTGSTYNGYQATANAGNPSLVPLESDNVDLSLEWYYNDTSYASVGFFEKRVNNFVGTGQEIQNWYGIQDQTHPLSPRVLDAVEELTDLGLPRDDTHLFAMIVFQEHRAEALAERPDLFPDGVLENNNQAQLVYLGEHTATAGGSWDVVPEDGDPLMEFLTSRPVNNREAKLYGAELAVQHFFGETGFGVQANYTIVRGDVGFDNLGLPTEEQFALTGLSDTANLVLMYENFGFSGRLAYNWRDEFLNSTNQGSSRNPRYTEAYSQLDFNLGYDITEELTVSFEGLNITGEDSRVYNRNGRMIRFADDLGARYQVGIRYTF